MVLTFFWLCNGSYLCSSILRNLQLLLLWKLSKLILQLQTCHFFVLSYVSDVFRTQPNNYNSQLTIFLDVWLGFKYASDLIYVLLNSVSCFDVALLWKTFSLFNHILDDGIEKIIVFCQLFYINTLKYFNFHHCKLDIPRPTLMVISRLSS